MKKSDIVKIIKKKYPQYEIKDIKFIVDEIFEKMIDGLVKGENIEIRKIGSFKVLKRKKPLKGKKRISYSKTVHFKPGRILKKALKEYKLGENNADKK